MNVIEIKRDEIGNIILMKTKSNETVTILGSIYGPNSDEIRFFEDLKELLQSLGEGHKILGGDWNATWDSRPIQLNQDTLNMRNIPSVFRSNQLNQIATEQNLFEPFRHFRANESDFSYVPNAAGNLNRSRIDFFLTSESLINSISDSFISPSVISKNFDHKMIFLKVNNPKKQKNNLYKIKENVIKEPILKISVNIVAIECCLVHSDELEPNRKNNLLTEIGTIMRLLKDYRNAELDIVLDRGNINLNLDDLLFDINERIRNLPILEFFTNLETNCSADFFFETLANSIKNEILTQQHYIYKIKNEKKLALRKKIKELKMNYHYNQHQIFETEALLAEIIESDLREELLEIKKFELLNHEKITPKFLQMAKATSKTASLDVIEENGVKFNATINQNNFIKNYYRDLYKKRDCQGTIEDFLGHIKDIPCVTNSKLNNNERDNLDRPLSIIEFDKAMEESNMHSSAGLDGISNKVLRQFWPIFRLPLYNYAICCFEKGNITTNFATAKIRLIPKKGDLKELKNWRPISLLCCGYKILSRVVANRIKTVSDKITSVAQKGYSSSKMCQEVLINLVEGLHSLKKNKKKVLLVSVDMKKAFDSINHEYMESALTFFNFGPALIRWIKILSTNRKACIINADETIGEIFELERGNAQGDVLSPFIFNICFQILLIKIEFDPDINGVLESQDPSEPPIDRQVRVQKTFAFADDSSILTDDNINSLRKIKSNLNSFGILSGLECNIEKTSVIPYNFENEIPNSLKDVGFEFVDQIKILGLTFRKDDLSFSESLSGIQEKIVKQINFWHRFNLSLPGRIAISKSMLVSQVNYLGCFLPIPLNLLAGWQNLIDGFVTGKLKIAKDRLYKKIQDGGLNLIRLDSLLNAQKVKLLKRASGGGDYWKNKILEKSFNDQFLFNNFNHEVTEMYVLSGIANALTKFTTELTKRERNFRKAPILNNNAFTVALNRKTPLRLPDIELEDPEAEGRLLKVTLQEVCDLQGTPINKADLELLIRSSISERGYHKILSLIRTSNIRFSSNSGTSITVKNFVNSIKKGSKKIYNYLEPKCEENIPHNIIKYASSTETVINYELSKKVNSLWYKSFLTNKCRTFAFKLFNNILGTNQVVSHFIRNIDASCTFCNILNVPDHNNETILHLFYQCRITENFLLDLFNWLDLAPTRVEFFAGKISNNRAMDEVEQVLFLLIKLYIWDSKKRSSLPDVNAAKKFVTVEIKNACLVNNKFKRQVERTRYNDLFLGNLGEILF